MSDRIESKGKFFTVAELVAALGELPQEAKVIVSVNFKGTFHVEQAHSNVAISRDGKVIIGGTQGKRDFT